MKDADTYSEPQLEQAKLEPVNKNLEKMKELLDRINIMSSKLSDKFAKK